MKYRFILTYQATDSDTTDTRTCFPMYGNDLAISIDRAEDEWYYTRNLDGKLVFTGDDYAWIMDDEHRPFDGTFTLNIQESHDGGATYYDYFTGTFSRASLEIDEDNKQATLNGIKEGFNDLIKNGAKEEYDLMKLIPDSEAKEVQGQVPPALAMVDYRSDDIEQSDVFCGGPAKGNGYKEKEETGWSTNNKVVSDEKWYFNGNVYTEAQVKMKSSHTEANGLYAGILQYSTTWSDAWFPVGTLTCNNGYRIVISTYRERDDEPPFAYLNYRRIRILDPNDNELFEDLTILGMVETSPTEIVFDYTESPGIWVDKLSIMFHYIRATLLTQSADGVQENVLDTGDYYKGMAAFNNQDGGLIIAASANTSEQPNGHRMVPGTDEYGGTPQYFAPPDESGDWIPLAEDNWNYASMWYTIEPSITNGLTDPNKFGSFRWTRCWTIGTCIKYLLNRITDGKVVFNENTDYSQFLYGNPNPVQGHEPFQWLVTQKSNVMRPTATGAARCIVKLNWFLELLRNAFNCYYWFEKVNGGTYNFRIEHVEYFRRGGAYSGQLADQLDLTRLKPYRNFLRNGQPAKRYADQTNRYTFDLDNMVEKYTYSWQGDGGGDDFKGNPMYFRAGWIEKGSSDDRQVDNIFADLGWLMLNAGTDTESSKNYDGLFIFGGYRNNTSFQWKENSAPENQMLLLAQQSTLIHVAINIYLTAPEGYTFTLLRHWYQPQQGYSTEETYTGTGSVQCITVQFESAFIVPNDLAIDFGSNYTDIVIHRIHAMEGNVFNVPNIGNKLRTGQYLQNGCLAWPWLQNEYLHYDIPAAKWTYKKDDYTDDPNLVWENNGTIKMVKKQTLAVVPVPDANTEQKIMNIMGIKTGLGIGIIDSAMVNLSSRNAEMTVIYDINPQNN